MMMVAYMTSVLLDTHVLVWILTENKRIGKESSTLISNAIKQDKLYISAISVWEIAMLVQKGRVTLLQPIHNWYKDVVSLGVKEIPLYGDIAIDSVLLDEFHADPADRIIVATAIGKGYTLVTSDKKILTWPGSVERFDAEK